MPSKQLKHALNARKQLKTSAKRAKTVPLTRKMAKSRPPIALSLETLSNQSMDESSTISRFHRSIVGLSSITQQRYVFCAQFNRSFCSKEQASKPTTRRTIEQRNVISQIAIELLFFVSFLYDCITSKIGFQCTNSPNRSVSGKKRPANPTGHESKTIEQSKGEIDNRKCMNWTLGRARFFLCTHTLRPRVEREILEGRSKWYFIIFFREKSYFNKFSKVFVVGGNRVRIGSKGDNKRLGILGWHALWGIKWLSQDVMRLRRDKPYKEHS